MAQPFVGQSIFAIELKNFVTADRQRYDYSPTPKQEEKQKKLHLSSEWVLCANRDESREYVDSEHFLRALHWKNNAPLYRADRTPCKALKYDRLWENRILKFVYSVVGK